MIDLNKQFPDRKIVGRFNDPIPEAKRKGATWAIKQHKAKVDALIQKWEGIEQQCKSALKDARLDLEYANIDGARSALADVLIDLKQLKEEL